VLAAEDRIRARGLAHAELGVEVENPRARTLYERLGYIEKLPTARSAATKPPAPSCGSRCDHANTSDTSSSTNGSTSSAPVRLSTLWNNATRPWAPTNTTAAARPGVTRRG